MADVTIIGGGIAGLTTAIALRQRGIASVVFEAAPEVRAVGAGLSLAPNAMLALRAAGLEAAVLERGHVLPAMSVRDARGRIITATDGRRIARTYGAPHVAIHRADLHDVLLAQVPSSSIIAGKRALAVDEAADGALLVRFHDGDTHQANALILADGIHSPIRQQLLPDSSPRYAGYTCWRAVVQYEGAPLAEASETWGPAGRFGLVPLRDKRVYWFAVTLANANDQRFKTFTSADLLDLFRHYHDPIPDLLRITPDEELLWNDIIDLKPLPRWAFNHLLLIGDAAHATTPNLGQGACQAIEDAVVLAAEMARQHDAATAFRLFERRRLPRARYVVNRSRAIGRVAQIQHPWLGAARNALFRALPASAAEQQFRVLYDVRF